MEFQTRSRRQTVGECEQPYLPGTGLQQRERSVAGSGLFKQERAPDVVVACHIEQLTVQRRSVRPGGFYDETYFGRLLGEGGQRTQTGGQEQYNQAFQSLKIYTKLEK